MYCQTISEIGQPSAFFYPNIPDLFESVFGLNIIGPDPAALFIQKRTHLRLCKAKRCVNNKISVLIKFH